LDPNFGQESIDDLKPDVVPWIDHRRSNSLMLLILAWSKLVKDMLLAWSSKHIKISCSLK